MILDAFRLLKVRLSHLLQNLLIFLQPFRLKTQLFPQHRFHLHSQAYSRRISLVHSHFVYLVLNHRGNHQFSLVRGHRCSQIACQQGNLHHILALSRQSNPVNSLACNRRHSPLCNRRRNHQCSLHQNHRRNHLANLLVNHLANLQCNLQCNLRLNPLRSRHLFRHVNRPLNLRFNLFLDLRCNRLCNHQ